MHHADPASITNPLEAWYVCKTATAPAEMHLRLTGAGRLASRLVSELHRPESHAAAGVIVYSNMQPATRLALRGKGKMQAQGGLTVPKPPSPSRCSEPLGR